ncbi:MAG TPA: SIS domain-containing protein [Elusimicrobiota bacterium]|jgi:D-sedoheptulose 7-phosphate isomerase|nr:SIS domain-containing protein [Elusimicrobiota bacterium]
MSAVTDLFDKRPKPADFARGYLDHVAKLLAAIDEDAVAAVIDAFLKARERGARILFIGNGGSAATSSHFANDIGIGTRSAGKPFKALSLTDNNAVMTAIANDDGYEQVFVQQLKLHLSKGDVVVAISASGNSPNLLRAIEHAKEQGAVTVSLTGFDGGKLKAATDLNVHVATTKGEYGPVEDLHMVFDHLIGAYLMNVCRREREAA